MALLFSTAFRLQDLLGRIAGHNELRVFRAPPDQRIDEAWDRTEASLRIDAGEGSSCVLALSNPMHEEDFLGA